MQYPGKGGLYGRLFLLQPPSVGHSLKICPQSTGRKMFFVDVLAQTAERKIREITSSLGIPDSCVISEDDEHSDYSYLSAKHGYLIFRKVSGHFTYWLTFRAPVLPDWPAVEHYLLPQTLTHASFMIEQYDNPDQAPWDYYLISDGKRYTAELLEHDDPRLPPNTCEGYFEFRLT
ncbi:hypothetical protein [Halocynthiibacter styelae]|uniref:Uncharacterized protein n=1 Tax=Halocynthiibacter styelae TaxID=2761955 RepID=A0A8J7LU38_9RHOB|nr:hypothetical protein [Paenihalocynthiibacter styelae]MBI1492397.1 hypothetical protein [Paenihalocynthiibacter styelae]